LQDLVWNNFPSSLRKERLDGLNLNI
jgi:hypothetical protein